MVAGGSVGSSESYGNFGKPQAGGGEFGRTGSS